MKAQDAIENWGILLVRKSTHGMNRQKLFLNWWKNENENSCEQTYANFKFKLKISSLFFAEGFQVSSKSNIIVVWFLSIFFQFSAIQHQTERIWAQFAQVFFSYSSLSAFSESHKFSIVNLLMKIHNSWVWQTTQTCSPLPHCLNAFSILFRLFCLLPFSLSSSFLRFSNDDLDLGGCSRSPHQAIWTVEQSSSLSLKLIFDVKARKVNEDLYLMSVESIEVSSWCRVSF